MASGASQTTTLAHRSVASIRTAAGRDAPGGASSAKDGGGAGTAPSSPHTPLRGLSSAFGSPSSLRADEDSLVIDFGSRALRVGLAGDAAPKAVVSFGPEHQRRVGDFRTWELGYRDDWRGRATGELWGKDYELWRFDVRGLDLGLVGDRLERALREAFTKYLLLDSRGRRVVAVLPSVMPTPVLSTVLDMLMGRFQSPTVSLLSAPVMTAFAAGVRSALVVDLGWHEAVVSSIYEYREVQCRRSIRGGRMLVDQVHKLLKRAIARSQGKTSDLSPDTREEDAVSFEECEEVTCRMVWCKPASGSTPQAQQEGLPTVQEQDESDAQHHPPPTASSDVATIPLRSSSPPITLQIPYDQLAEPCESAFFETQYTQSSFDDHELPIHQLVYRALLDLPLDVRAVCMSRIIFTGGCAKVLGLRWRVFDELSRLVRERGWDPVQGKAAEQLRSNPKLKRRAAATRQASARTTGGEDSGDGGAEQDGVWHDAANAAPEVDPIEEGLRRRADSRPRVRGVLRAVDSLGAWAGASLMYQLKVPVVATVDRELWLQQGVAGASRPSEVDYKAQQRQSLGPAGGLMRGSSSTNWTLGTWGSS